MIRRQVLGAAFVGAAFFAGATGAAQAAGGHCPAAYDASPCNSYCVRDAFDPSLVRCDITAQPGDNALVAVTNYRAIQAWGTATYSAWGTANGANFCCSIVSNAAGPINSLHVLTGGGDDEVWLTAFDANGNEKNLTSNVAQTTSLFQGKVYPGAGDDYVQGSNSTADDYRDYLTGEDGADTIYGNKGADFLSAAETRVFAIQSVGNHGEALYGGNGRDEIVGATNNISATDTIFVDGGNQNDLLCTGPRNYLTAQKVYFWGGAGNDQIYSYSSFVAGFDGPIDGGSGTDGCDNPGGGTETACEAAYNPALFTAWTPLVCN
ncbi:MAG: hypothetical protein R3B48_04020 [Kofleriaceae bacterium]